MDVKEKIKEFIVNNFLMGADSEKIQDDTSFLEEGIIDSTGILELVEFIQDTFLIAIEDEELIPDNLDCINNIEKFINSKKQNSQ
ncbi:MAG: acyl carrier protein [Candidatus Pacebacteria bacterium]|nr:acyl carrier protein [Candidatus Paceibacterota bacterium]